MIAKALLTIKLLTIKLTHLEQAKPNMYRGGGGVSI